MALLPGDDGPYVFESVVPPEAAGRTVVDYLVSRFTYRDAESWTERLLAGDVSIGEGPALDPSTVLSGGEAMACVHRDFVEQDVPTDWTVAAMGEDWMAVSKPSGMPVHSTPRIYRQTLVWQVRRLFGEGWTPAHRLDRDTSGLVVFSRGTRLPRWLGRAFSRNAVRKEYLALVRGSLTESVNIDLPISLAQDPRIPLRRRAGHGGQEARTLLVPLGPDPGGGGTWVLVHPEQGRTHQIRVHCEAAGFPIAGDLLYDGKGGEAYLQRAAGEDPATWRGTSGADRLHLHAWRLRFADPPPGTLRRELSTVPPASWGVPPLS
jgi:RluA family pseudouridine synthase